MSCRPPANHTYLAIGQDLFSVNEYVTSQYNYSLHQQLNSTNDTSTNGERSGLSISNFVPSTFMVYTDLETLKGLWEPTDYGSGVEYADGMLDLYPSQNPNTQHSTQSSTGLQIGLWLNGTQGCFSICAGEMDDQIQLLVSYLERSRASKIFLRLGYEFDNPSFGYSDDPAMYILAFRKIVSDCREHLSDEALGRVLFVWHSWAAPMAKKSLSLAKFYPGDEFVDWIGVSIFQQVYAWSPYWGGSMSDVENVLEFAKKHDKPTIIAESTPFGGIELKQASNDTKLFLADNEYDHDDWGRWFGKVIDVINKYDIGMLCYINCNWENQPMWHKVGFGQTLLSSNPHVMSQWYEKIIKNGVVNRTFLASGSLENCGANPGIIDLDGSNIQSNGKGILGLSHFYSFILVPFLVVSGAFFVPYFILGGHKARSGRSSVRERRPLLSSMDESTRASPAQ
eukprot:CAMPEP_0172323318 /NCGR_PEP_ID=MMETSP1058-20130122/48422_1 /TAXON_ID=83371 /ORGANISM="Detonula confervacea, Strain CCMP 353" /LENGTH=452 /DNA_ID=CAMNT_0013039285 /DNA_START=125 /DNA_END=1480 /DNA_ORIENTATION=+